MDLDMALLLGCVNREEYVVVLRLEINHVEAGLTEINLIAAFAIPVVLFFGLVFTGFDLIFSYVFLYEACKTVSEAPACMTWRVLVPSGIVEPYISMPGVFGSKSVSDDVTCAISLSLLQVTNTTSRRTSSGFSAGES
jgi:hypothetical protein